MHEAETMNASSENQSTLRVVQSVCGVFHHFDLARELYSQGNLEQIYSTFPWARLKRESLPRSMVSTFPLIDPVLMLLNRYGISLPRAILRRLQYANIAMFDRWVSMHIPECEAFVAISSFGLLTGQTVQKRGGKYVCDRGSAHIRFQLEIVADEYRRWGVSSRPDYPRIIPREEAEYARADAITVPSEFSRRSFIQMGVPGDKVYKIPYGVSLQKFYPVEQPPKDSFEVLFVGQVNYEKGIPYLLQAFSKFSHPNKRLRLVGTVREQIRPYLAEHLPPRVEVLGAVPQSELKSIMSSSHVMVLPSIQDGFGMVLGQAMACGCPVISSTNTGGPDLFTHGIEGFEVPIRSADAILERLQQLADDPVLQQQMGRAALEKVKHLGGWRDYGEQYLSFLKKLVSEKT
jgi:starch synthase